MAKLTAQELIDAIKELTVLELNDLVKAIEEEFGVTAAAPVAVAGVAADDILLASEIGNSKYKVIFEDTRAYPFTLNGNFRASCVFRIKVDRSEADEQYYTSGEVITRTAANGVRLWISNINAIKFTIIADSKSYDLDIGKAGQVVAQDIKWIKDTDGKYKLVVIELD